MSIKKSITELIGSTPLLELTRIERRFALKARLVAKLEAFNPGGSVKDRVAYGMLRQALDEGKINAETEIIEPTSGNTGIGLALVGAALGLKVSIVLPETMSVERRNTIRAYGANLVLTDGARGMKGAIEKAEQLHAENPNSFIPQQFENPANARAHYETTGPEIYEGTSGEVDVLVAGVGTGGTLCGAGRYLKERKPGVKLVAVEPEGSPVLSGGKAGAHGIQGIGAGFVPGNFDRGVVDEILAVSDRDALATGRLVARTEGVFLGISAGAAIHAALEEARKAENAGKTVVVVVPDSGDRYLSTALYKSED